MRYMTPADRKEVRRLSRKGLTHAEIGDATGFSRSAIGGYLRGIGESNGRSKIRKQRFYTEERNASLERGLYLYKELRHTVQRAADLVGQTHSTLRKYIQKKGALRNGALKNRLDSLTKSSQARSRRAHYEHMLRAAGELIRQGLKGAEIAERLGVSSRTVSRYKKAYLKSLKSEYDVKRAA
jgi:predicted transcriptional regulator